MDAADGHGVAARDPADDPGAARRAARPARARAARGARARVDHGQGVLARRARRARARRSAGLARRVAARARPQAARSSRAARRIPVGDALRFHSALIRDAVYESVPKRSRAVLHERVARGSRATVGEQARPVRGGARATTSSRRSATAAELGPLDDHARAVGREGAGHLALGGRRAFARGDMAAAAGLLASRRRAAAGRRPRRASSCSRRRRGAARDRRLRAPRGRSSTRRSTAAPRDDARLAAKARLVRALVEASSGAEEPGESVVREAERATAVFEPSRRRRRASRRRSGCSRGRTARRAATATPRGRAARDRARRPRRRRRASTRAPRRCTRSPRCTARRPSPRRSSAAAQIVDDVAGDRRAEGLVTSILGWLEAMRGDFDLARALAERAGRSSSISARACSPRRRLVADRDARRRPGRAPSATSAATSTR